MYGSTRLKRDYMTFSILLEEILRDMGHEVERRPVVLGEKISCKYNYAFCGVAPLNSITSGHIPETHYVMDCLPGRHAVFADDWSFCNFGKSIKGILNGWEKYLKYKCFSYRHDELDSLKESLEKMSSVSIAGNNAPMLAPMFPWGDHSFLMKDNYVADIVAVDPSAWLRYPSIEIVPKENRKLEWVMAALANHMQWVNRQKFQLPVRYIGNKRMGSKEFTEDQTVAIFANSFGVLSTGYPSKGSGWWRTRYLNAAWAETPIYSDPDDAATMGEAFQGTSLDFEIEAYLSLYDDRVEGQREWLYSHIEEKESVMATLERLMAY